MAPGVRRRVMGLRREELAMLAGISAEYYLRLEVGRDNNPSAQVVDALARALRLDVVATDHIHRLASASGTPRLTDDGTSLSPGTSKATLRSSARSTSFIFRPTLEPVWFSSRWRRSFG